MVGGMGAINSNLVIRSETKGEMLEFLVLITGYVSQRQWAKAQHWHNSGGMFICCSFRGRVACRNCDTFLCHPALPLTRSHTGAPFPRKYTMSPPKHIRKMCATSGYRDHLRLSEVLTYQVCQVTGVCRCWLELISVIPQVSYLLICKSRLPSACTRAQFIMQSEIIIVSIWAAIASKKDISLGECF